MSNPTRKQVKSWYPSKKRKSSRGKKSAPKKKAPGKPVAAKASPKATGKKAPVAAKEKVTAAPKKQAAAKKKATAPPNISTSAEYAEALNTTSDQCQFFISRKKTPDEYDKKNCKLTCDRKDQDLEVIKYKKTFQCNLKNTEITLNLKDINNNNEDLIVKKLCHYHIKKVLGLKIKKIISVDPTVTDGEVPKRIISYEVLKIFNVLQQDEICGYSTIKGKPDIGNLIPLGDGSNDNVMVNGNIVIATKDINYGDKLYLKNPGTEYKKIEPLKKRLAISGPKGPFTNENTLAPVRVLSPKKV